MKTRMAQTSLDAYYELDISPKQAEVLAELKKGDCTRQQLAARLGWQINAVCGRVNELLTVKAIHVVGAAFNDGTKKANQVLSIRKPEPVPDLFGGEI